MEGIAVKTRYAQVGLGARGGNFYTTLARDYRQTAELVGVCDINPGRLALTVDELAKLKTPVKGYTASNFEAMIRETKPNTVIVTTIDNTHDEYICKAMELGCDIISEKPLTTTVGKLHLIVDMQQKTGRRCQVTFNYRYSPPRTQVKDLLMSGVIGEVLSVDFQWMLDTSHGADYFRRWHRHKINSGGLMIHKATHHFDLVNWWLGTVPEAVFATGSRKFYTPQTADRYGLTRRSDRCLTCREAKKCPFNLDMRKSPSLKMKYLDHEQHDGYFRDRCVFSPDIDIEDSVQLTVRYKNGVNMGYSLNAFMPWEGYRVVFNGSKGRLEHTCVETAYISGDGRVTGETVSDGTTIVIHPHFRSSYAVPIWEAAGGHGGGDPLMFDALFNPSPARDKYMRAADYRSGAYSIVTGMAANYSMATGREIRISELIHGIPLPDMAPMPLPSAPILVNQVSPVERDARRTSPRRDILMVESSSLRPAIRSIEKAAMPKRFPAKLLPLVGARLHDLRAQHKNRHGSLLLRAQIQVRHTGKGLLLFGLEGPARIWVNGKPVACRSISGRSAPGYDRCAVTWMSGLNDIYIAINTEKGKARYIVLQYEEAPSA